MRHYLLFLLLSFTAVASEVGCSILKQASIKPCESEKEEVSAFINITPTLREVELQYHGEVMKIQRKKTPQQQECPPFCLQPMEIEGVQTVGELETLKFIKRLKVSHFRLLLDVRENKDFKQTTIPGAINLPYSMLENESPYLSKVLTLLGAKEVEGEWRFKKAHHLLIFGEGRFSSDASTAIQHLLAIKYPKEKILYYRGGVKSWKEAGLTLYKASSWSSKLSDSSTTP